MTPPSYIEDHISQIPALQLLMKMGYEYLTPAEALALRGGRESNVILDEVLKESIQQINSIEYKGRSFPFSESNIAQAINALKDLPMQEGYLIANKAFYDLIVLGKSFEQTVMGDKKSFSFRYIDWQNIENNQFHVTEEFSVLRTDRNDTYRPDIVIFINGIPMVVIECKSPAIKDPIKEGISQSMRNQQEDGIRSLYLYSNMVMSLAVNEARYATTSTKPEFWSVWKEVFREKDTGRQYADAINELKNRKLPADERTAIFKQRFRNVLTHFNKMEEDEIMVTEQDKQLYSLCQKERLLDLIHNYIVYDDGEKKICRYQQFFAIKETLNRVVKIDSKGRRKGGVIWHTQGSGKSLTMVMLAQLIAANKAIKNPKIVLVTDRIDLNTQITETFQKCKVEVEEAASGKNLIELLSHPMDAVITTIIHKFEAAVNQAKEPFLSTEIFVLIDEGHRSQYGIFNIKMQKIFPNACFIAFTGTPLMKSEKSTADKFGGLIDVYSIIDAVADKAVVPLLYEGRHNIIEVNETPLDSYFNLISEPLTPYGKAALKRKYSTPAQLNKADQLIYARSWDIRDHFVDNIQGTGFKGQLVAPNKTSAIKYRDYIKEIGKVTCEVLISSPDMRENNEDAFEENEDAIQKFYKAMLDKHGSKEKYEKNIISAFKKQEHPEIIIVVDKLLTGFDAPINQVLYLTRSLKEHTLLQAIARVNRVAPGKDYGLIIDYYGNLENLDTALTTYSGYDEEEIADLSNTVVNINKEIEKLPQAHSELWQIFKSIKNKFDAEAYALLLKDESIRHTFYDKLSAFVRLFKLAMTSYEFNDLSNEKTIRKYKDDLKFFLKLRVDVKRRYYDDIDHKEYEKQVQKLIDKHVSVARETLKITDLVNIFDKEEREAELEKITGAAAKADHIAASTVRLINIKMKEDPSFYKKLSALIKEAINDYHQQRIDEAEYLKRVKQYQADFLDGRQSNVPAVIKDNDKAIAYYNLSMEHLEELFNSKSNYKDLLADIALRLDQEIMNLIIEDGKLIIDWQTNDEIEKSLKIALDDTFYEIKQKFDLDISFEKVDQIIEEIYSIAKAKYI
jgi:type I restriction enzyme, R subunit